MSEFFSDFFDFLSMGLCCGTLLGIAFMVALSLPKSRLRAVMTEVCSWAALAFCIVYTVSPIDVIPEGALGLFGYVEDIAAVYMGWQAVKSAKQARKERKEFDDQESASGVSAT